MPKDYSDRLADYVDVDARLAWFFDRYKEGSLQSEIVERGDGFVTIKAYAYRMPADPSPGVGHASEPVPGRTPYTKDSEVMNAETSAWGRALAAVGAPTKGHIASADEVAARTSSRSPAPPQDEGTPVVGSFTVEPTKCAHRLWEEIPNRQGWERCLGCGTARKRKAQTTLTPPKEEPDEQG